MPTVQREKTKWERQETRRERKRENEWGKKSASTWSLGDNGSLIRAYPLSLSSTLYIISLLCAWLFNYLFSDNGRLPLWSSTGNAKRIERDRVNREETLLGPDEKNQIRRYARRLLGTALYDACSYSFKEEIILPLESRVGHSRANFNLSNQLRNQR